MSYFCMASPLTILIYELGMQLNLARKWRSKQFSTIVGQELVVKILKNGLFTGSFFPVYLFSGTRGCGKTTTARVFAAAINCEKLSSFQKDPSQEAPCGHCRSCVLAFQGKHSDFIEIDAASHTGVDNVREIIESASLLPIIGSKKIYLIDEAHMLSKAAFNAFLKILEEPPATAIFMLATTEPQKIIETVRSRCFQLFFQPIAPSVLIGHIRMICEQEHIPYELPGIVSIADEAQGSARDAINILERIRLSTDIITRQSVLDTLHQIDIISLINLFDLIAEGDKAAVLISLQSLNCERFTQLSIWKKCVEIIQALIWLSYGVDKQIVAFIYEKERLERLAKKFSQDKLVGMLEKLYYSEQAFLRTAAQSQMLEMLFLILCDLQGSGYQSGEGVGSASARNFVSKHDVSPLEKSSAQDKHIRQPRDLKIENNHQDLPDASETAEQKVLHDDPWKKFLHAIEARLDDPLVHSIFKQAHFDSYDETSKTIKLTFAQKLSFFSGMLQSTQTAWLPLLHEIFGVGSICEPYFSEALERVKPIEIQKPTIEVKHSKNHQSANHGVMRVTNAQLRQGEKARALLQFFPGTLSLMKDDYE